MTDITSARGQEWPEELTAAAAAYRAAEKDRYRSDGFEDRMRAWLAADEDLNRSVGGFWRDIEAEIFNRFRSMIPQDPGDRDKGPKVFEVHHEIAVGKECFLLRLDETGDPKDASEFTRRRLALIGDPAEFYAEFGEPESRVDDAPEPA